MFDFNLTDITATLCVGLLGLTILGYLYFITQRFFYKNFDHKSFIGQVKEQLGQNHEKSGYVVLGTILIYGMGFIIGDLTGRMTNSDSSQHNFLDWLSDANGMKKQEETRWEAFVQKNEENNLELSPLGKVILRTESIVVSTNRMAGTKILSDATGNALSKTKKTSDTSTSFNINLDNKLKELNGKLNDDEGDSPTKKDFRKFIQQVYYTSKNWCFSEDKEPLKELKAIQNRIDMLRSFVFLMDFSALSLVIIVIGKLGYILYLMSNQKFNNWDFWRKGIIRRFVYLSQIIVFSIFFLVYYLSKESFEIDQENYLKRACGYYVSHVNELPRTNAKKQ